MNCCRTVRIPENKMWKIWEYNRFVARYDKQYGEKPPKIAIAKHLGVSRSVLYEIEKSACMVKIGSLSSPLNDEEDSTVGDGKYVYSLTNNRLVVYDLNGNVISTTVDNGKEIYVSGNNIVSFGDKACVVYKLMA